MIDAHAREVSGQIEATMALVEKTVAPDYVGYYGSSMVKTYGNVWIVYDLEMAVQRYQIGKPMRFNIIGSTRSVTFRRLEAASPRAWWRFW